MRKLREVLGNDDTVLFIGSGISSWSGLPSWPQLIAALADFIEASGGNADTVRAAARRGDLVQAASYGFFRLTKPQIGDFVRRACRYGLSVPQEIHRKITLLGPRCYVTTNYDDLIERSLRLWQPDRYYRPSVTNRHLLEMAELLQARAVDFVFKPHGDASDADSIILTREQYRQLLPGGERHATLETLKTLMLTRPVVYIGFGLHDPDFDYLRDLIANTYRGGARDHFAIMPDVSAGEADYWRSSHGVHIISYPTAPKADGTRNHQELLSLLDDLQPTTTGNSPNLKAELPVGSDLLLTLARYSARLTQVQAAQPEFLIRVHSYANDNEAIMRGLGDYDHFPVERLLYEGPTRVALIGAPGAGKTYALHRAAARIADELHGFCLSEQPEASLPAIPLVADLKLYTGSIYELLSNSLPSSVSLDMLAQKFPVRVFLDSFNEMPREYWESGAYESDFTSFLARVPSVGVVVGSRTNDGLGTLGLEAYYIDEIDRPAVLRQLSLLNVNLTGRFRNELEWLFSKPFYFDLLKKGAVVLPEDPNPAQVYRSYLDRLDSEFAARFGGSATLSSLLATLAFVVIDDGHEAVPSATILRTLQPELDSSCITSAIDDVLNWLISKSVLVAYSGARLAFFHQSVTEYLAAKELARLYIASPNILKNKLRLKRWDHALFMTLALLSPDVGKEFVRVVSNIDLPLALRATKYLEIGRDAVVSTLLGEVLARAGESDRLEGAIAFGIEISEEHVAILKQLARKGGMIGGAAVERLVQLRGATIKSEILGMVMEFRADYNFIVNGVASALKPLITVEDIETLRELADRAADEVIPGSEHGVSVALPAALGELLEQLDVESVRKGLLPSDINAPIPEVRSRVLCDYLRQKHTTAALDLAGELLLKGVPRAATAIYFIANFRSPDEDLRWNGFTVHHVNKLLEIMADGDQQGWALKAMGHLILARPEYREHLVHFLIGKSKVLRAALTLCVSPDNPAAIWDELASLSELSAGAIAREPVGLLSELELTWIGHESMFVKLLRVRDLELASAIISTVYASRKHLLGDISIGDIYWWLDWIGEELRGGSNDQEYFVLRMGWLFGRHLVSRDREMFLAEFNRADSKYRKLLASHILSNYPDLTTDQLSNDAISFLLADLHTVDATLRWRGHLLGRVATERFVTEHLLPLLASATGDLLENIKAVLRQAGDRHGVRYETI